MNFNLKRFLFFFLTVVAGSLFGSYVNVWLGIKEGADIISQVFFMLVPVLSMYLIWEWWLSKKAQA